MEGARDRGGRYTTGTRVNHRTDRVTPVELRSSELTGELCRVGIRAPREVLEPHRGLSLEGHRSREPGQRRNRVEQSSDRGRREDADSAAENVARLLVAFWKDKRAPAEPAGSVHDLG